MQNKSVKAFSLAELMVVLFILTIILATTMPILSKRTKIKTAAVGNGSSNKSCVKIVNSSLDVNLSSNISTMYYSMVGGGGGGGTAFPYGANGGGGGSSAILINNVLKAVANGGDGGIDTSVNGKDGSVATGTFSNLTTGQRLTIYPGGGGGGANAYSYNGNGYASFGAGGAGYFGGNAGNAGNFSSNMGKGGATSANGADNSYGSSLKGGDDLWLNNNTVYTLCAQGGNQNNGGQLTGQCSAWSAWYNYSGGGGGFGGAGGNGYIYPGPPTGTDAESGHSGNTTAETGNGGAGNICTAYGEYYGKGGGGGSVILFYTTTASNCFL